MEEKLKEIVSVFIKVAPGEIGPATRIDRSAVQSSILLHRMYARLAQEGVVPADYNAIKVFGDLVQAKTVSGGSAPSLDQTAEMSSSLAFVSAAGMGNDSAVAARDDAGQSVALGIDVEDTAALPRTSDFRRETFYTMNFAPEEIAYCILQPDPYASFTGLFAAKEAIVKAGARRRGEPFNKIPILHSAEGKPLYPGLAISIAHTPAVAVAVAARSAPGPATMPAAAPPPAPNTSGRAGRVAWLALLVGILALLAALIHRV